MCGIVGVFGRIDKTRIGMFEDMLAMDGTRGRDSTGVAIINDHVTVVKDVWMADRILANKEYRAALKQKPQCMIGHNRAATLGLIIKDNAHPFRYKHITMVHNGTLKSRWRLPDHKMCDTDSEAIARCIADHGIEITWSVIEGAATLVWWNDEEKTLNVLSNNERPFFMQPLKSNDGIVWSSERWMLQQAAKWHDVEFEDPDKVYAPVSNLLYSFYWKPEKGTYGFKEKALGTYKWGNTVPGYQAVAPYSALPKQDKDEKKNRKRGGKKSRKRNKNGGSITVIKSAESSAAVFQEWKGKYLERHPDTTGAHGQDLSDEALRNRYPELFDPKLQGLPGPKVKPVVCKDCGGYNVDCTNPADKCTCADLDTRGVPFRPAKAAAMAASAKNARTAERFKQLFDLVEINAKYTTAEWWMMNYRKCCECEAAFVYNDSFTARNLSDKHAICELCQMDAWIISGLEPSQIRLQ